MKDKILPPDYDLLSVEELTEKANKIIASLERENDLSNSVESYQELLKLNNIIEKKFHKNYKSIGEETNNQETVFESGAILIYLAEKSGKFYDKKNKSTIDQWLMAQMGIVGPFVGQYHYFYRFNKGLSEIGEKRYYEITKSIYDVLNERLTNNKFLAGENYSIADIATWPWIARHEWHDIGLNNFENLKRWYVEISKREAVIRGFQFMNKNQLPPQP